MQSLESYYTKIDRELLELAEYHKRKILKLKEHGGIHPDDEKNLLILNDIPRLVNGHAQGQLDYETQQKEIENNLMQSRQLADCPKCKQQRSVKIKGETKHPNYGWKC